MFFILIHQISISDNPNLDAWLGARDFAAAQKSSSGGGDHDVFLTKQEYEEHGQGYFKEHLFSNRYCATPDPVSKEEGPGSAENTETTK